MIQINNTARLPPTRWQMPFNPSRAIIIEVAGSFCECGIGRQRPAVRLGMMAGGKASATPRRAPAAPSVKTLILEDRMARPS